MNSRPYYQLTVNGLWKTTQRWFNYWVYALCSP